MTKWSQSWWGLMIDEAIVVVCCNQSKTELNFREFHSKEILSYAMIKFE